MRVSGHSFPHPVLGLGDDIDGNCDAKYLIDYEDTDKYKITVNYVLNNSTLSGLISEKKAEYVCEISCSTTIFRKCFESFSPIQKMELPKSSLRNRVDLRFFLCSAESVSGYQNPKAHTDYKGYKFDLEKGDLFTYFGVASFMAVTKFEELKAVSTFMEIVKGDFEKGDFIIHLDEDKIKIELSRSDYKYYSDPRISRKPQYAAVFHSSIVLPALIHALHNIKPGNGNDTYSERPWYQVLTARKENDNDLKNIQFEDENIPRIAQKLLGIPLERLLASLMNLEDIEVSLKEL